MGLRQSVEEAAGRFDKRGGRVHVVPDKVVQQQLEQREEGAEGRQPELGQLGQVARVAQPRLQRALRRVLARLPTKFAQCVSPEPNSIRCKA